MIKSRKTNAMLLHGKIERKVKEMNGKYEYICKQIDKKIQINKNKLTNQAYYSAINETNKLLNQLHNKKNYNKK